MSLTPLAFRLIVNCAAGPGSFSHRRRQRARWAESARHAAMSNVRGVGEGGTHARVLGELLHVGLLPAVELCLLVGGGREA